MPPPPGFVSLCRSIPTGTRDWPQLSPIKATHGPTDHLVVRLLQPPRSPVWGTRPIETYFIDTLVTWEAGWVGALALFKADMLSMCYRYATIGRRWNVPICQVIAGFCSGGET